MINRLLICIGIAVVYVSAQPPWLRKPFTCKEDTDDCLFWTERGDCESNKPSVTAKCNCSCTLLIKNKDEFQLQLAQARRRALDRVIAAMMAMMATDVPVDNRPGTQSGYDVPVVNRPAPQSSYNLPSSTYRPSASTQGYVPPQTTQSYGSPVINSAPAANPNTYQTAPPSYTQPPVYPTFPPITQPPYVPPVTQAPYAPPRTQAPYVPPRTQAPYVPPVTQPPYGPPITQPPYVPPVTRTPYVPPVTQAPYVPPVTQAPYVPPVTQAPYVPPVTQAPYVPPVTQAPYVPPVTQAPYVPPVTQAPYLPPVTQAPYVPPVTQAPYQPAPTSRPSFFRSSATAPPNFFIPQPITVGPFGTPMPRFLLGTGVPVATYSPPKPQTQPPQVYEQLPLITVQPPKPTVLPYQPEHPSTVACPLDILLMVDASGRQMNILNRYKREAIRLVEQLGWSGTRMALVSFGEQVIIEGHMKDFGTTARLMTAAIQEIRWQPGGRGVAEALGQATLEFDQENGARSNKVAKQIAVIYTNGFSCKDPALYAQELRDRGVIVYVMHADGDAFADDQELQSLTGSSGRVFGESESLSLIDKIKSEHCGSQTSTPSPYGSRSNNVLDVIELV